MHTLTTRIILSSCLLVRSVMSLATSTNTPRHIVVVGGGVQGVSVAYQIAIQTASAAVKPAITVLEAVQPASAASGKGGGFMARSWGDGTPTQSLHETAFDMYEQLAVELGCESYRKLPVLSVSPGYQGIKAAAKNPTVRDILPAWLDGAVGRVSCMGLGEDTAQITPKEFVDSMLRAASDRIQVVKGTCTGVETDQGSERASRKVTAVTYQACSDNDNSDDSTTEGVLPADVVIVSAGPWSCAAEDWFRGAVELPMEGIKSTSIVWKKPQDVDVDATALFCGEDNRFGTHLEVYPRPDGTIYICGIGGSDYINKEDLKQGAFRGDSCQANEARVQAAKASFQEMSSVYKGSGELDRAQACMRPCPPDAMPYMGNVPGYEGAYINAGHNCWGIAWAPACGKAIAELVLDGHSSTIDLSPFDPARFTPATKRGGRGRKRQGESVGEQW